MIRSLAMLGCAVALVLLSVVTAVVGAIFYTVMHVMGAP